MASPYYAPILAKTVLLFPGVDATNQAVIAQWMVDNITSLVTSPNFADERDQAITNKIETVGVPPDTSIPVYAGLKGATYELFRTLCEYSLDLAIEANTPGGTASVQICAYRVSQAAVADPTVDVKYQDDIQTNTGVGLAFNRTAMGIYELGKVGAFTGKDVQCQINNLVVGTDCVAYITSITNDAVQIETFAITYPAGVYTETHSDDILDLTEVRLYIYP